MKLLLITFVVIILPQITHSAPGNSTLNGSTYQQEQINKSEMQRKQTLKEAPSSSRAPSAIPCPVAPQARDTHVNNLAKLENHSTTCPEGGAIIRGHGTKDPTVSQ